MKTFMIKEKVRLQNLGTAGIFLLLIVAIEGEQIYHFSYLISGNQMTVVANAFNQYFSFIVLQYK